MPLTGVDSAVMDCERLREQIETHDWSLIQPGLQITVSGGICVEPLLRSPKRILARADTRPYAAKHQGREHIQYTDFGGLN